MNISIEESGDTARLILSGKYDVTGVAVVGPVLSALAESKHGVIVDLTDVSFLTSAAIRTLIVAGKTLTRRGGRLALLRPTAAVEEVLITAGVNSLIPIARSEREAKAVLDAALGE